MLETGCSKEGARAIWMGRPHLWSAEGEWSVLYIASARHLDGASAPKSAEGKVRVQYLARVRQGEWCARASTIPVFSCFLFWFGLGFGSVSYIYYVTLKRVQGYYDQYTESLNPKYSLCSSILFHRLILL